MLHVSHIIELETPSALLVRLCVCVLNLQRLVVHLGTGAQLVLGIGEEVVWTVADEVRAAHPWAR